MYAYYAYNELMTIMVRDVDRDLNQRFKILCTMEGVSMNKKIKELIQEYVERQERERKQNKLAL